MKAKRLAQTLLEMTDGVPSAEVSSVLDSFIEYLKARGYTPLLPQIKAEFEELVGKRVTTQTVVTVAKEQSINELLARHEIEGGATMRIDETIVGGYQIETETKLIDASYKNALLNIYQSLTR